MPERMQFEFLRDADPLLAYIETNLDLVEGEPEHYPSPAAAAAGSFVAQLLSGVSGLQAFTLEPRRIILHREPDADWDAVALQAIGILREEFL